MLFYKSSQADKKSSSSLTVISDKSVLIERIFFLFYGSSSMLFIGNCWEGKEKGN